MQNFISCLICASDICRFVQKVLESVLSILESLVHLLKLENLLFKYSNKNILISKMSL